MALIRIQFFSDVLGMCTSCNVILPQCKKNGYTEAISSEQKFPVLWLLHGASGDCGDWLRNVPVERYTDPLRLAVVMPSAHLSSYSDMTHGGRFFTFISEELPEKMRTFFPLSEKREDNFIAGNSMGSGGALKIALAKPDHYAAAGCFSSGLSTERNHAVSGNAVWEKRLSATYEGRETKGTEEDTVFNAMKIIANEHPAPRILHTCGSSDFMLSDAHQMRDFFMSLENNPFGYTYEETPGVHDWSFWEKSFLRFLEFIMTSKK